MLHGGPCSEARELVATVEAGWVGMALSACTLEQSERERSEGRANGRGERAPAQSPHLRQPEVTSGTRMEHCGHALGVFCPGYPFFSLLF
jgi:hypothetical protein